MLVAVTDRDRLDFWRGNAQAEARRYNFAQYRAKVARLLWEGRGYAGAEFSFISLTEPSVPAALDKLRRIGAARGVDAERPPSQLGRPSIGGDRLAVFGE